jgi:proton glutamate symport protein
VKLTTKIFIALLLGAVLGGFLQNNVEAAELFQPIGDIYIRLIKMIMVPLVFSTLVLGITNVSNLRRVGEIGLKTFIFFLVTTTLAAIIGLIISNIIEPGKGMNLIPETTEDEVIFPSVIDTFVNIVPESPLDALVKSNMLQVIFFGVIIGIGIIKAKSKGDMLREFFVSIYEVISNITGFVMKLTPIGVFGLIVPVVAKNGLDVLLPLSKVILAFYIAVILQMLLMYALSVKFLSKVSVIDFFKGILPAQLVAFTTCSSAATLPITLKRVQEELKVSKEVSGFVLPLGATINMDGNALYQGITALFVAQAYGIELTLTMQIMVVITGTLASIGAAGVPGAGMIVLSMVLSSVGLPVEGIALVAGIDRIIDMGRTLVNVTGDATTAVVISKSVNRNV